MKLAALDANSLLNRAFYAIRPLSTRAGSIQTRSTAFWPTTSGC